MTTDIVTTVYSSSVIRSALYIMDGVVVGAREGYTITIQNKNMYKYFRDSRWL